MLFGVGLWFVRRGKKEKQKKEERCPTSTASQWDGVDRRTGVDRRRAGVALTRLGAARRNHFITTIPDNVPGRQSRLCDLSLDSPSGEQHNAYTFFVGLLE